MDEAGDEFESIPTTYGSDVHEMYLSFVCGEWKYGIWKQERYSTENFRKERGAKE